MRNAFLTLALIASLGLSTPLVAQAQAPAAAPSAAASTAAKKTVSADQGKTMQKVLSKLTLSADEKAKTDKIMADSTLKGAKRRDAIRAALTAANQPKFDAAWKAAHSHKGSKSKAPAASASSAPSK
jgi:hypothetical protein